MKKNFKFYALIWAVALAVFQVVVFLVRPQLPGVATFDGGFWTAWAFLLAAFVGNLVCAYLAFRAENLKKMFYRIPLLTVSRSALVSMAVAGCVLMLIPLCPPWVAAVVCVLILAFHAVAVVKAGWAADAVESVDEKVKTKTFFIRSLTTDAESLLGRAQSDAAKAACKKVYEAVRYSDPMSNDALANAESQITLKFNEFSNAVTSSSDSISSLADELVVLLGDRNKKCKLLK